MATSMSMRSARENGSRTGPESALISGLVARIAAQKVLTTPRARARGEGRAAFLRRASASRATTRDSPRTDLTWRWFHSVTLPSASCRSTGRSCRAGGWSSARRASHACPRPTRVSSGAVNSRPAAPRRTRDFRPTVQLNSASSSSATRRSVLHSTSGSAPRRASPPAPRSTPGIDASRASFLNGAGGKLRSTGGSGGTNRTPRGC
mmetsp:Transcript_56892/g.180014  ORF Transcript_56892/g.180014 Transcript_56892/m.180014 type:complete len:206 (+) Transcript_56892:201-818(+)